MVALSAFVLVFIAAAVAVVAVGIARTRRGTGGEPGSNKLFIIAVAICIVGIGLAVPLWLVMADHKDAPAEAAGGVKLTASQEEGRALFASNCATCHTLAASHAVGKTGPNLDVMRPPAALIYNAISVGRAQGNGNMPAGLVTGQQAKDVASYVAAVAGQADVAEQNSGSAMAPAGGAAGSAGGASMGSGGSSAAPAPAKAGAVAVTLTEMKIVANPNTEKAGEVAFDVKNAGQIVHEMVVLKTNKPAGKLGTGATVPETGKVGETGDVAAGKSKSLKLKLAAGHYALICNIPGHYTAGMYADFTVK